MSDRLTSECRKAFEEWSKGKEEDLYGLEWMAWQAAWDYRYKQSGTPMGESENDKYMYNAGYKMGYNACLKDVFKDKANFTMTFEEVTVHNKALSVDEIKELYSSQNLDDWKAWRGGEMPYPPKTPIQIKWADGEIQDTLAGLVAWSTLARAGSIHYRSKT